MTSSIISSESLFAWGAFPPVNYLIGKIEIPQATYDCLSSLNFEWKAY